MSYLTRPLQAIMLNTIIYFSYITGCPCGWSFLAVGHVRQYTHRKVSLRQFFKALVVFSDVYYIKHAHNIKVHAGDAWCRVYMVLRVFQVIEM